MAIDKRGIILSEGDIVAFTVSTYRHASSSIILGTIVGFEKGLIEIETENGSFIRKRGKSIVKCASN